MAEVPFILFSSKENIPSVPLPFLLLEPLSTLNELLLTHVQTN